MSIIRLRHLAHGLTKSARERSPFYGERRHSVTAIVER